MDASRAGGSAPYRAPIPAGASRFGAGAPSHLHPAIFAAVAHPLAAEFRPIRAAGGVTDARPVGAFGGVGAPAHLQPALFAAGAHPLAAEVGGATDARAVGAIGDVGAPAHLQPALFAAGAHPLAAEFRSIGAVGGATVASPVGAIGVGAPAHLQTAALFAAGAQHLAAESRPIGAVGGAKDARPVGAVGGAKDAHSLDVRGCYNATSVNRFGSGAAAASRTDYTAHVGDPRSSETADQYPSAVVRKVWRENSALEFMSVLDKLRLPRRRLFVAVDMEYVAHESTDVRYRPIANADWYQHLRDFVNCGDVVQLGLVLAFEEFDLSGGGKLPTVMALEINLQLDVNLGSYNPLAIDFLQKQGHRLDDHRDRGVFPQWVFAGLLRHLPFGDRSTIWITYHGDRDLGFLLRLLQAGGCGVLPPDRAAFLHQVREKFPIFYDVRVLGQIVIEGFAGKLTRLAQILGIDQVGDAHFAATDALMTLHCFWNIMHRFSDRKLAARLNLLSGAEELDMAIRCATHVDDCRANITDVREQNFDEEAKRIAELISSNFRIIGLKVIFPKSTSPMSRANNAHQEYDLMKRRLSSVETFEMQVGFMNPDGMIAYGRVWKFQLSLKGTAGYADPRKLAKLMASSGISHNSEVSWVGYDASHGIGCLIKSFMMPCELPAERHTYMCHRRAFFPATYDMGFIASRCGDIGQLLNGSNGPPEVITVLQCFKKLSERQDFLNISLAVLGKLMIG